MGTPADTIDQAEQLQAESELQDNLPNFADTADTAGNVRIESNVIAAIVGHAANGVEGVVRLGNSGGLLRAVTDTMRSSSGARGTGVDVEASENVTIIDLDLVVEYGYAIMPLVQQVRQVVAHDLKQYLDMDAREMNVNVVDIEFPNPGARRLASEA